ncbi:uncharacterized protein LOC127871868 isoform X2 [Dreissena polymorpha]|uniref:uncharacterized protein LOC127871868 isoform X2 n=1 Tax=Dreissena polymorpha TaxID=45954 RepID=UPI002264E815|nr:uncharacterized protein LOC127871868 isoform X2 [Dreissena polymorpha]
MTTFLKLSPNSQLEEDKLHLVPADIQYNGQANVNSYFATTIRQTEDKMTSSLRGRPLQGAKFEVPSGYTGIFLTESRRPVVEGDDRELTGRQTFKLHSPLSAEEGSQSSLKSEVSM